MTAQSTATESAFSPAGAPGAGTNRHALAVLVLARAAAAGGASKAEIVRDLTPLLAPRFDVAGARAQLELNLAGLVMDGGMREHKARFQPTESGLAAVAALLGPRKGDGPTWSDLRDHRLLGLALGLDGQPAARWKSLAQPDGLRALVLIAAFGLKLKPPYSPSRVRTALAMVALERAFGNTIKGGLGSGKGLPSKASRLLAGQLSRTPRDFGTDSRLIAAMAAEQAGVDTTDVEALKLGVLRRWVAARIEARVLPRPFSGTAPNAARADASQAPTAPRESQHHRPAPQSAANDAASARPGLEGFSTHIREAALKRADGWSGNRKAFISHVWETISADHPDWRLSEIEFKCMLAEAHRAGLVVLANADLKDKRQLKEFQASAVTYKNTVWHFVRVED